MKFRILLIGLLLATAPQIHSALDSTVAEFATMIRINTGNKPEEEAARQTEVLKHIVSLLPDYGKQETLELAIAHFLRDHFAEDYRIVNSKSTSFFGRSKDEVFFIQDAQGKTRYVVKAFLDPETLDGKFVPEISAITLLHDKQQANLKGVEALGVGKCQAGATGYGLLLESVAPGKLLDQYIAKIGQSEGQARSEAIQKVAQIYQLLGQAFAELHHSHAKLAIPFPEESLQKMRQKLEALDSPDIKAKLDGNIDRQALQRYAEKLIEDASHVHMVPCYQHSSPHSKNVFYDIEHEQIVLIDVAKMHPSIDIEGNPLGDGAYDLVRIQENLVRDTLSILDATEVQALLEAFFEGYRSHEGVAEPAHIQFHTIYRKISRLSRYGDYDQIADPKESDRHRLIFDNSLHDLQEAVK